MVEKDHVEDKLKSAAVDRTLVFPGPVCSEVVTWPDDTGLDVICVLVAKAIVKLEIPELTRLGVVLIGVTSEGMMVELPRFVSDRSCVLLLSKDSPRIKWK